MKITETLQSCPSCKQYLERKTVIKQPEIYNLKKMDFGRYLIGNNIDAETGRGLIANPEKYGKKNFEIMKLTYKSNTNAVLLIQELINMI